MENTIRIKIGITLKTAAATTTTITTNSQFTIALITIIATVFTNLH